MVDIEINGIPIKAQDGQMLIEAADEAGITIPRFCYHKKLSVAANCRMCLVEVEKAPKPLPACATPVTDGMRVFTQSSRALGAQKGVMEFLLINHPLDCPICDHGGECDLQEMAMGYGRSFSRYDEPKRVVEDHGIGPLIATEMTRCIHCTRCVRFGDEIAGVREMGAVGRGEHTEIGTYIEDSVDSELSGNIIDICPVGALTSKPFRYHARPWELSGQDGIAAHDCVGANVRLESLRGELMRVVARDNEAVNETWIADRERFSYTGLDHVDRVTAPMARDDGGQLRPLDWNSALEAVGTRLKAVLGEHGGDALATLVSPSATLEEAYLAQKVTRGLGSGNIDHRLQQQDFSDDARRPNPPSLGLSIAELENIDGAVIVGGNLRKDQPLLNHRLRKAALKGGRVAAIEGMNSEATIPLATHLVDDPRNLARHLAGVAVALAKKTGGEMPAGFDALAPATPSSDEAAVAEALTAGKNRLVVLGQQALNAPDAARIRSLAGLVAGLAGAHYGELPLGGNSPGAWLAGAIPHRGPCGQPGKSGHNAAAMVAEPAKAYLLIGSEIDDVAASGALKAALEAAELVIAVGPFADANMRELADIILPGTAWGETAGTYVNIEGRWQGMRAAAEPPGEARPTWKILRVFGNVLGLSGFDHVTTDDVRGELEAQCSGMDLGSRPSWQAPEDLASIAEGVWRIADLPIYGVDGLVRRAGPLQHTADAYHPGVAMSRTEAERHGVAEGGEITVRQGDGEVKVEVVIDERVPDNCVWLPAGLPTSMGLGAGHGPVELAKN